MRCQVGCVYRGRFGRCRLKSLGNVAVPADCPRLKEKEKER
jgi:hypothetical protein